MKVARRIGIGLFVAVVLTYLFIIVSPKIFKGFYPFGIKTAIVLTGSMEPTIEVNDFVVMAKPDKVNVGDIVSYEDGENNKEVLHRVVRIDEDNVVTKGDANNTEDQPIKMSHITGVYIGKIGFLGKAISFVTRPLVFSVLMTVFLVLMLIPRSEKVKEKSKKRGEKNEKA